MKATQICSVDGCERTAWTRGWCGTHYQRWRLNGTTDLTPAPTAVERFAAGLTRMPNGCLEWTKYTNPQGYGQIGVGYKIVLTHRFAWTLANGLIPDGLNVLHHCDNPPCCETDPTEGYPEGHLFLGTLADNNADMRAKGRARTNGLDARTHCNEGHLYDEANTFIRRDGSRGCRICAAAKRHARYLRTGT